jgi:hypothetical protein
MKIKIKSKDFRVRPGKMVSHKKMADEGEAHLQIKEALSKTSGITRCRIERAAKPSLRVQPLCAAADYSGDGRRRQGRRNAPRRQRACIAGMGT